MEAIIYTVFTIAMLPSATAVNRTVRNRPEPSAERRLVNELLHEYEQLGVIGRPVFNMSDPVDVAFGLGLIQMDLEEKDNVMLMSAWTKYQWRDEYLQWDPAEYDGVQAIKLPSHLIWNPDIMLYNTASTEVHTRTALAVVSFNGLVTWFPHRVFESSCSINVRYFPFDNQTCHMFFGSWTHTVREINVSLSFPSGIDLSTLDLEYNASSKWEITAVQAIIVSPDPEYNLLSFTLKLKRKMMFSSYILTVPAVFLSFLTLVVFALPAEDGEKTELGLAIFGSLLLLLLIIVEAAPPTASAVPLLGIFYCFTTVIVILSAFMAALVVKVGYAGRGGRRRPVPKLLHKIVIKGIGTLLCVRPRENNNLAHHSVAEYTDSDHMTNGRPGNGCSPSTRLTKLAAKDIENGQRYLICDDLHAQILDIRATVSAISKRQRHHFAMEESDKCLERDWLAVAAILDRLFFWIYLVAIILSIVFLFPWSL